MARSIKLAKPKMSLFRSLSVHWLGGRSASKLVALDRGEDQLMRYLVEDDRKDHGEDQLMGYSVEDDQKKVKMSCWVPHPRNGIYYPKGNEWVMDDVPNNAASFDRTYWLRSDEGVEKPLPEDYLGHPVPTNI